MAPRWLLLVSLTLAPSLAHAQRVEPLEVQGHAPAAFVAPEGAGPRPLVVALHGNFDRPEWMCAWWAEVVRGRAFLLCPRGVPRDDAPGSDRWSLPAVEPLMAEIAAGRRALESRYPGRLIGTDVYVGFSQGAHRVASLAARDPGAHPRIQLVEGGRGMWRRAGARRYARHGGRVAVVCAMQWCETRGERMARTLERGGRVAVQRERIPAAHADLRAMGPAIQRTFDWLIAGDRRFESATMP
ncbi:MAG: hypothetical protein AB8I08_14380 [Sandaracinaceae bacterium]